MCMIICMKHIAIIKAIHIMYIYLYFRTQFKEIIGFGMFRLIRFGFSARNP